MRVTNLLDEMEKRGIIDSSTRQMVKKQNLQMWKEITT